MKTLRIFGSKFVAIMKWFDSGLGPRCVFGTIVMFLAHRFAPDFAAALFVLSIACLQLGLWRFIFKTITRD